MSHSKEKIDFIEGGGELLDLIAPLWTELSGHHRALFEHYSEAIGQQTFAARKVGWQFVSAFLSIVEYCLVTSPNKDGSLPQDRAEEDWTRCYEGGLIKMPFCDRKWAICRDWLEKQGVIKVVDRNWRRNKAMRWEVGRDFHRLPQWWRRKKKRSLLEAVPLEEFLRGRRATTGLNTYSLHEVEKLADRATFSPILIRPPP